MIRPKLSGEGTAFHPTKISYDCNSSKIGKIPLHGCIQCKFKGCQDWSCPICHPERHKHHKPFRCYDLPFPSNLHLNIGHVHDWQEFLNHFICKICGEIKSKPEKQLITSEEKC